MASGGAGGDEALRNCLENDEKWLAWGSGNGAGRGKFTGFDICHKAILIVGLHTCLRCIFRPNVVIDITFRQRYSHRCLELGKSLLSQCLKRLFQPWRTSGGG